jgi:nitrogen fixation/metabolism regulation signal transduction histidine kinase
MNQSGYLLLGLTAIVAALAGVLANSLLRIFSAARAATKDARKGGTETQFMAAAMEDAVRKLRDRERTMQARAEASERLSGEIVASLTSGLLVVDRAGIIRILNPAGQAMLNLSTTGWEGPFRQVLKDVGPLANVLQESLETGKPSSGAPSVSCGGASHSA